MSSECSTLRLNTLADSYIYIEMVAMVSRKFTESTLLSFKFANNYVYVIVLDSSPRHSALCSTLSHCILLCSALIYSTIILYSFNLYFSLSHSTLL